MKLTLFYFVLLTLLLSPVLSGCGNSFYLNSNYHASLKHRGRVNSSEQSSNLLDKSNLNADDQTNVAIKALSESNLDSLILDVDVETPPIAHDSVFTEINTQHQALAKPHVGAEYKDNFSKRSASIHSRVDLKLEEEPKKQEQEPPAKKKFNKYLKITLLMALFFIVLLFAFAALFFTASEFVIYLILYSMAALAFTSFAFSIVAIVQIIQNWSTERGLVLSIYMFIVSGMASVFFVLFALSAF
jgi:hypothetical protein